MSVGVEGNGHVLGKREKHEVLRWQRECVRQLVKICG
jgi:hypothetical protein